MRYRSRAEIVAEILGIADGGASETKLRHGAYLTDLQLKEYLGYMRDNGLLEFEENAQIYKPTEKAKGFLRAYEEASEALSDINKVGNTESKHDDDEDGWPPGADTILG